VITELNKEEKISEKTIRKAIEELQISDIEEIFPTLPRHMKIVVVALCMNARKNQGYAISMFLIRKRSSLVQSEKGNLGIICLLWKC